MWYFLSVHFANCIHTVDMYTILHYYTIQCWVYMQGVYKTYHYPEYVENYLWKTTNIYFESLKPDCIHVFEHTTILLLITYKNRIKVFIYHFLSFRNSFQDIHRRLYAYSHMDTLYIGFNPLKGAHWCEPIKMGSDQLILCWEIFKHCLKQYILKHFPHRGSLI